MRADRLVCATCGGVTPVEKLARYGHARSRVAVSNMLNRVLRLRWDWVLWFLAAVPFLLLPPLTALTVIGLRWPHVGKIYGDDRVIRLIILLAVVNIVGSLIVLTTLSDVVLTWTGQSWGDLMQMLQPARRNSYLRYV